MEQSLTISTLNDFIFCPASIYFHDLERGANVIMTQTKKQISGTHAHRKVDASEYSDKRAILQGTFVYSETYKLVGKIDSFDIEKGILTERKKKITTIYDGYVFQLYAQYFALKEMGYDVKLIRFYSMDDNKVYKIKKPEEDIRMFEKFQTVMTDLSEFKFENFKQTNVKKCENCIYEALCYFSMLKEAVC